MTSIISPFFEFFTNTDGTPLENGKIYIGKSGQDPEQNPADIFFDENLTISAAQPIRTIAGRVVNNGSPANVYSGADYSMTIRDKNDVLIYTVFSINSLGLFLSRADFEAETSFITGANYRVENPDKTVTIYVKTETDLLAVTGDYVETAAAFTAYNRAALSVRYNGGWFISDGTTGHLATEANNTTKFVDANGRLFVNPALRIEKTRRVPTGFAWAKIVPLKCTSAGNATASDTVGSMVRRDLAGFIGAGEVWVDGVNGLDTNPGGSTAPLKTIDRACRVHPASRVYVLPGEYPAFSFRSTDAPGGKLKILRAMGPVDVREAYDDLTSAVFTSVVGMGRVYSTPLTPGNKDILSLLKKDETDAVGQPRSLFKYGSTVEVNSNVNGDGWFEDTTANLLFIRIGAGNHPDAYKQHLEMITGDAGSRMLLFGAKMLIEGDWQFKGVNIATFTNAGTPELYMDISKVDRPTITHSHDHGIASNTGVVYAENVWVHRSMGDNFHPLSNNQVEINCRSTFAGDKDGLDSADGTNNGSSMHGSGNVIRINGDYEYNWGPAVVDTGSGASWNVGVRTKGGAETRGALSGNDYGFYTTGPVMTLDLCEARGHAQFDIAAVTGGTIEEFGTSYRTKTGTITEIDPTE